MRNRALGGRKETNPRATGSTRKKAEVCACDIALRNRHAMQGPSAPVLVFSSGLLPVERQGSIKGTGIGARADKPCRRQVWQRWITEVKKRSRAIRRRLKKRCSLSLRSCVFTFILHSGKRDGCKFVPCSSWSKSESATIDSKTCQGGAAAPGGERFLGGTFGTLAGKSPLTKRRDFTRALYYQL